jgi:hypothetical protein
MNKTFEQQIKEIPESRIRTVSWALEKELITGDEYNIMLMGTRSKKKYDIFSEKVGDYNEFFAIVFHEGKDWLIKMDGHDYDSIHDIEKSFNKPYYKKDDTQDTANNKNPL